MEQSWIIIHFESGHLFDKPQTSQNFRWVYPLKKVDRIGHFARCDIISEASQINGTSNSILFSKNKLFLSWAWKTSLRLSNKLTYICNDNGRSMVIAILFFFVSQSMYLYNIWEYLKCWYFAQEWPIRLDVEHTCLVYFFIFADGSSKVLVINLFLKKGNLFSDS